MAQKHMNSKEFKKELANKELSGIYLFLGEEEGEKDKRIVDILDKVLGDGEERRNSVGRFYCEDQEDFLKAVDFTLSQSMFSPNKVCVIRNLHLLAANKKTNILVNDMIENRPDSTVVIMTSGENKIPSTIDSNKVDQIKIVQFWKFFDSDIITYINHSFKKAGIDISDGAIRKLVDRTGKDIKKIDEAIDIIRYSGETGVLNENVIDNFIHDVKDVTIFEFIDLLYMKEKKSLKMLKKLIEDGTPDLLMLAMIQKRAELIEKYYLLTSQGISGADAIRQCGINKRNIESFRLQIKINDKKRVQSLFASISKTDMHIKSRSLKKGLVNHPIFSLSTEILFNKFGKPNQV